MIRLEVVSEMIGKFEVILPGQPQDKEAKEKIIANFREHHMGPGDRYKEIEQ